MAILATIIAAVALLAAMLYLTLGVNEFEKQVRDLDALARKRYQIHPLVKPKTGEPKAPPLAAGGKG